MTEVQFGSGWSLFGFGAALHPWNGERLLEDRSKQYYYTYVIVLIFIEHYYSIEI